MAACVLIIDDHPLMRDAIRITMDSVAPGSRIDLAGSYAEARRMLATNVPYDFTLLDLNLPDCAGFDALRGLREHFPHLPTVVLSAEIDRETILRCLDLGAAGYIPKTYHGDLITHALRLVSSGHVYVPREAIDPRHGAKEPIRSRHVQNDPRHLGLTDRQCDVLRLILRGLPNKLICRQLDLAEGTVKVHVSAVLRALGVRNRTQAVIAASRLGLRIID
ncbi:MAG: response regulator transcription factor [Burkholderiaceae bacterium]|nr:response regulator transcription factor [Burkholderiaceae bacterium]